VWKFVLSQRFPHTGKYVGFVVYVESQNTAIFVSSAPSSLVPAAFAQHPQG